MEGKMKNFEILHKIDKGLQLSNALAQLMLNQGRMLFQYAMIHNKQLQFCATPT